MSAREPDAAAAPLLAARGLVAGHPGAPPALRGVTFAVAGGQVAGVLGPNGGGKTTLLRVLTGELAVREGEVDRPSRVAVVPQTERARLDFPVSAHDVALMGATSRLPWWRRPARADRALADEALRRVGLHGQRESTFGALSGGQRQRVLVARALVQDAPAVLLDEPFRGLDRGSAERLEALLGELADEGRAVLVATHDVAQARRWDLVLCLNGEQVAFGPPGPVLTPEVLARTGSGEVVGHHGC